MAGSVTVNGKISSAGRIDKQEPEATAPAMSAALPDAVPAQAVVYPDSDGMPMADNTKQFDWIVYQQYGVNEFYIYDPDNGAFSGYVRVGGQFEPIPDISGWKSPLTGVTFQVDGEGNLVCTRPDGGCFESFEQLSRRANAERTRADAERTRADRLAEKLRALGVEDL